MNALFITLQAGGGMGMILPMVLVIIVFYFFMIRPQVKRQKELSKFRNELKEGDEVVTTGGIYGKVTQITEKTIKIRVDSNVNIRVDKASVLKDFSQAEQKK